MESLVDDAGLAPVLAAARKVEALNTAIAAVAFFLGKNVQTMAHEIFQEEVERSYENCERTIGGGGGGGGSVLALVHLCSNTARQYRYPRTALL